MHQEDAVLHPRSLLVLGAPAAVLLLAPAPATAWRALTAPTTDPTAPLLAVVALAATALSAWLLLGTALVALGALPGLAGGAGRRLAALALPRAARQALQVALGAGLVLGGATSTAAASTSAPDPAPASAASLDWPVTAPVPVPAAPAAVVVRPGDTLWDLAEQALRTAGEPAPTAAAVAATWPSWWAANRDAVGDDPHLLRPGTALVPPS